MYKKRALLSYQPREVRSKAKTTEMIYYLPPSEKNRAFKRKKKGNNKKIGIRQQKRVLALRHYPAS